MVLCISGFGLGHRCSGFELLDLGFDVWVAVFGFGFWSFSGFEFGIWGLGLRISGFGFGVWGFRSRVSGFEFRVSGFEFRVSGFGL